MPSRGKAGLFLILALVTIQTVAVAMQEADYGTLNPDAPKETGQFGFLAGKWNAEMYRLRDGEYQHVGKAIWSIRYILNGWALQDEWVAYDVEGKVLTYGTMYRSYNTKEKTWKIVEQTTPDLDFLEMTAEQAGDTMIMYERHETEQGEILMRRVFSNISGDYFDWSLDRSRDGGKTWETGLFVMKATRLE